MASRLIQQENEAQTASGYVPPAPVASTPVFEVLSQPQAQTVLPAGLEIPTVLLANHVVEPELLGVVPRIATPKPSLIPYVVGILAFVNLLGAAQSCHNMVLKKPEMAWVLVFPALFFVSMGVLALRVGKLPNNMRDALRNSTPYRAFVESVGTLSGGGSHTVTYWYADAAGGWVCGTAEVPSATVALLGIAPGYIFTLLVSPHGEGKPLPYFMASHYRVVPVVATAVSHDVSARVAALEAERLAATSKQTGTFGTIEPELLQTAPRPLRLGRQHFREGQTIFAVYALLLTLWSLGSAYVPSDLSVVRLILLLLLGFIAVRNLTRTNSNNELLPLQYLAFGTPTRALVIHEKDTTPHKLPVEKHSIVFRYKYESADGKLQNGTLTVPRKRAWQLGLCEGATFTVLYNPKHPEAHTPYFQITDAEIVSAMGAKVSPP